MLPWARIYNMLDHASSDTRNFPATLFYNEGWLLRVILDWFAGAAIEAHPLKFASGAKWFSEALLPSQFLARRRHDPLSEGCTHADAVIGHVMIGSGALSDARLAPEASQLIVTEAKLFSPLSAGVAHAPSFDQAARNVACVAEMLCKAKRPPTELSSLGFFVLAPAEQIKKGLFSSLLAKTSLREKVSKRVLQYSGSEDGEQKTRWLLDWFEPTLSRVHVGALSWEDMIDAICADDPTFGAELRDFYKHCLQFNRLQEPETGDRSRS